MNEQQNAAFDAAYKVAYEAALEAAQSVSGGYEKEPVTGEEDTVEISFRKILDAFRRHWPIITALTLLFALLGGLYVQLLVTPTYQASVNLIVQTNNVESSDQTVSNEYVNSAKNLAKTYARILNSSKVQNHVIKDLGLDLSSLELKEMAVAAPVTDSQIVTVTVSTDRQDLSEQIADAYLRLGPSDLNALVEAGKCNAVSGVDVKKDPIKPGMKRTVALGALLGFALSFAYALFSELRKHFIISTSDVKEVLNLPVIGIIPAFGEE
ncbi:MAG: hypothetical protein IJ547_05695 [Clostridia bacterium]|nr:hypothetical protein [Clostridia bacterium]MBQ8470069.1 hypothetical protein [Clostridia bacterium]